MKVNNYGKKIKTITTKKFTLKTPKPPVAPTPVTPQPVAPQEMPSIDVQSSQTGATPPDDLPPMDMSQDMSGSSEQMGDEMSDMNAEMPDMGNEMPNMGDREEVTFRTIQKLTGKLGQKLRMLDDSMGMTSEDIKYVLNSILSAVNLGKLNDEDREDILAKFEEDYDEDMIGSDEMNTDMKIDIETDDEEQEMPPMKAEIEDETEEGMYRKKIGSIMDSVFAESEVEKLLSQYYRINESEQLQKKNKDNHYKKITIKQVRQLAETKEQRESAEFIIRETSGFKFKGKTNLKNLVFEHEDNILKISLDGEFL